MIDVITGKEMTRREVIAGLGAVAIAGSANASVRHGLGARLAVNFSAGEDKEEEMYKELFEALLRNELTEIDVPTNVEIDYSKSGVRPFSGQKNLTKVKMPNLNVDRYGNYYFDRANYVTEFYLDSIENIPNSFFGTVGVIRYIYAPSLGNNGGRIYNSLNGAPATGAVLDLGTSRTCQQFIDSMPTLFENAANFNHGWTVRCSDGDVAWNGSEWAKVV